MASCTFSKVSKFLKISFALLGASYNVVQLILLWVTSQRIVFWKKAAHKEDFNSWKHLIETLKEHETSKNHSQNQSLGLNLVRDYSTLHKGLLVTELVILNHGQVTRTTPELAPTLLTSSPTGGRLSARQI
ncbi:hypothetical protein TNCV_3861931 [Trichonephila clavipes]|nr:hypothetical protein TNCV_3861931 [Trichonephila clavipes]